MKCEHDTGYHRYIVMDEQGQYFIDTYGYPGHSMDLIDQLRQCHKHIYSGSSHEYHSQVQKR